MSRITVIGGTGYAGSAIVKEAAARGHEVIAFSRSIPDEPVDTVTYVQSMADGTAALASTIEGADAVVAALSPRGALAGQLRPIYRTVARLAADAGAKLFIVGGFSSLRPAPGAPRFVEGDVPPQFRSEAEEVAAVVTDDLPQAPASLDWVFLSPAGGFGAFAPGERLGRYRIGGDVALFDEDGKSFISGADFALAVVDLIESGEHHRAHISVAY